MYTYIKKKVKPEMMTITELIAYIKELEKENVRLEELYQKAVGEINTDPLPNQVIRNGEKESEIAEVK